MVDNKFKRIYKKIRSYDTIVIARHIGPDPDAISSQIALRDTIKETFPDKKVYAVGSGVNKFKYIGLLDKINENELVNPLLIVVDVPNISRLDGVTFDKYSEVIKIDHHPIEDKMGEIEIVNVRASSAAEIIAELIFETRLKLTKEIAKSLYIGIVSDSNRFLLGTTRTLRIATSLIEQTNLNVREIYPKMYERPINEIRFQGYLGQNLNVTTSGLAYIKISSDIVKEYEVDSSTASNMINDFNYIKNIYVWTFITYDEKLSLYKVNIRSNGPIINEIASHFNGGGHKFASGVRTPNEKDIDSLLKELDEACKIYKDNLDGNS